MRSSKKAAAAIVLREWSPSEDRVARLLAIGYTQQMAADELGIALRTVQNYCAKPGFYEYVKELSQLAWERVEPALMSNMELALEVQRKVLLGEIDAKDGRYTEAAKLIQILIKFLQVATRDADAGRAPGASPTPSVNGALPAAITIPAEPGDDAPIEAETRDLVS